MRTRASPPLLAALLLGNHVMHATADAVSNGSSYFGGGWLSDAWSTIGTETEKVEDEVFHSVARVAMEESGRCPDFRWYTSDIPNVWPERFAELYQEDRWEPSRSARACKKVAYRASVAEIHRNLGQPSAVLDRAIRAMTNDILPQICNDDLMDSLRTNAPIRRKDPTAYRAAVKETLQDHVLTRQWVQDQLGIYCPTGSDTGKVLEAASLLADDGSARSARALSLGQVSLPLAFLVTSTSCFLVARCRARDALREALLS